ncbi:MAG: prolyl oligopeptidase family serine peptidase [Acidobacteriia bacterium]|nr:prolyl oligopeptidase family serine peptidase [Terriglobia bacterium]
MRAAAFAIIFFATVFGLSQSRSSEGSANGSNPPDVPRAKVEVVVDDYHGHKISDPYRWLEDSKSAETQQFAEQQNAHTRKALDSVPGRDKLRARLEQLLAIGRVSAPYPAGPYYFYERREGTQNQPVIYVREGLQGKDRALIDVNALAPDGTIALDWWYPSNDGKLVAYGTSPNGSEISTLRVIETASGRLLPEQIGRTRAASVAWMPDNSGFYYTKYPRPGDVPAGQEPYNRHVFFHTLGAAGNTDGLKDPLIFGENLDPQHWPSVLLSKDGRWLLVQVDEGWTKSELLLKDLHDLKAGFLPITSGKDFLYHVRVSEGQLYITTNEDAPRYRVFKVACSAPQRTHWKEIIPESKDTIEESIRLIGGRLFVPYVRNASGALSIFDLEGKRITDVAMPTLGSIYSIGGRPDNKDAFFGFFSFAMPTTVYHVTLDGRVSQWETVQSDIDPSKYEVRQLWFNSKDGTRVPMFVVHKKGLTLNGKNPTVLSGYGGFNVGRTPSFNRNAMLLLVEHGGVYADAQLRGGNEFGEEWHRGGMLDKKQNTFDDFIAAAEYLIAQKYTDKDHLAIQGGSNGGLLMGAVFTQRPDLFRAVVCQVPLLDMLRYQKFQIAKLWIPEYGSADDPKQFDSIYAYSPYHHVKQGTVYPAILFMTADSDTRVDPMHAKKMTALMQAQAGNGADRPILLRLDTKAGHGIGKPIGKILEDDTDFWSFVFWQLAISN